MMRQLATIAFTVLTVVVSAFYLPLLYEKIFSKRVEKTHLLFSPVTQRFIYKEKIVGSVPAEAVEKSEDHHAEIAYRDADGTYYTRVAFEKNLPFIYYKNMELWGLMPLTINGRTFDKKTIKSNRRVLELKPGEINDQRPLTPMWPLLESNPGQARLVFPEDRFRMTADAMQFVNADFNRVDRDLTAAFTNALKEKGFVFPARSVNGKFSILKPFDEGAFIVDAKYQVFHVKRRDGKPFVVRTPIDTALKTRHIKISENRKREYYGLLLAADHRLYLLTYDNYRLIPLPLEDYYPNHMDFKLLVNPLYTTAVWSDEVVIRAVAMDRDFRVLDRYKHDMSRSTVTAAHQLRNILFPFTLKLQSINGGYLRLYVQTGGGLSLIGLALCAVAFVTVYRLRQGRFPSLAGISLVAVTGLYGWIAVNFIGSEI